MTASFSQPPTQLPIIINKLNKVIQYFPTAVAKKNTINSNKYLTNM